MNSICITSEIIANSGALERAIDAFLSRKKRHRVHMEIILRKQQGLRNRCELFDSSGLAWRLVLELEEAMNDRFLDALRLVAVWAFSGGHVSAQQGGAR